MKSPNLLSITLKINALFSLVSGVLLIALHQYWQQIFGVSFPFHATGAGILLFAWYVFKIARQTPVVIKAARAVIHYGSFLGFNEYCCFACQRKNFRSW